MAPRLAGNGIVSKKVCAWDGTLEWKGWGSNDPRKWKRPRKIALGLMTDLFHENAKQDWWDEIVRVIRQCPQHTFLVLTKRPIRMALFSDRIPTPDNAWLGVSASTNDEVNAALDALWEVRARYRWLSLEPMVGPVSRKNWEPAGLVVVGAEKPMHRQLIESDVREVVASCKTSRTACYVKQLHINGKATDDITKFPSDLRVRQWPQTVA
jgi:protein gp37